MRRTLLTPRDVIRFTNVKLDITPCNFRELYSLEYYEARTCLGIDFWGAMIAALADYSDKDEWEAGAYSEGDIVKFQGVYMIALEDTTQTPQNATAWGNAPLFEGDCATAYDDLFCDFIGPYLAYKALAKKLPYIWTQIRDTGVLVYNGGEFDTANDKEYTRLLNAVHSDARVSLGNLKHFMDQDVQKENDCFEDWPAYSDTSCGCNLSTCQTCNNGKRRVGAWRAA